MQSGPEDGGNKLLWNVSNYLPNGHGLTSHKTWPFIKELHIFQSSITMVFQNLKVCVTDVTPASEFCTTTMLLLLNVETWGITSWGALWFHYFNTMNHERWLT